MPLRDHFHPPLFPTRQSYSFLISWACAIMAELNLKVLPKPFRGEVARRRGEMVRPDFLPEDEVPAVSWQPDQPTSVFGVAAPSEDSIEVEVRHRSREQSVVAVVAFVTAENNRSAQARRSFAMKCADHLRRKACVLILDLVTTSPGNHLAEIVRLLGHEPDRGAREGPHPVALSLRNTMVDDTWRLEAWKEPLAVGHTLPTLPLWLTDELAVPLDLEAAYEDACRGSRIP